MEIGSFEAHTILLGLIGHPVSHSLSPLLYQAAFRHTNLNGAYKLIDVAEKDVPAVISQLIKEKYQGFNVTIPYKQKWFNLSDSLTAEARRAYAVNCVKLFGTKLIGHNTDVGGLKEALTQHLQDVACFSSACIVGAGGAAKAAMIALSDLGTSAITIVARNLKEACQLGTECSANVTCPIFFVACEEVSPEQRMDILVNTTPIGQKRDEVPGWFETLIRCINNDGLFFDMVYQRHGETPLVRKARQNKVHAVDGIDMLVYQASLSFEYWTGIKVDALVLKEGLKFT